MTRQENLDKAIKEYTIGTRFKSAWKSSGATKGIVELIGLPYMNPKGEICGPTACGNDCFIYCHNDDGNWDWAEIISKPIVNNTSDEIKTKVNNFFEKYETVKILEDNRKLFLTVIQKYDDDHCGPLRKELEEMTWLKDSFEQHNKMLINTIQDIASIQKTDRDKIASLEEENRKLQFMVDNGLGVDDMKNDI